MPPLWGENRGRMSITEELREWADTGVSAATIGEIRTKLTAIADRIDAEHERGMADAFETRNSDENLESDGWVRLPKDADGEPIRVGDVLVSRYGEDEYIRTVSYLIRGNERWDYQFDDDDDDTRDVNDMSDFYENTRHYHEPTVEDVLHDFAIACEDGGFSSPDVTRLIEEYAAKLRLAGDGDD